MTLARLPALAAFLVLAALTAASASADPAGKTTLSETIQIAPGAGFRQLQSGPGEPYVTRQSSLGKAKSGRAGKRRSLLFFGQVTDAHIRDEIGRASCRGRGWGSGSAGLSKKKREEGGEGG